MKNKTKKEEVVFSKEIDSVINELALLIAFIVVGVLTMFFSNIFGTVHELVIYAFVFIGTIGLISIIFKNFSKLKGVADLEAAIILLVIFVTTKMYLTIPSNWIIVIYIYDFVSFLFFMISVYGLILGLIRMIFSVYLLIKSKTLKNKVFNATNILHFIKFLAEILGLILVILQIINIIGA